MITEVAAAIIDNYEKDKDLHRGLFNGLHFQQAPQDASGTYGVFYINGSVRDEVMGDASDGIEEISIQFNIFTDENDGGFEISTLTEQLTACYDWKDIFVDGYNYVKMQRVNILPLGFVDEIWQATIDYELGIEKV